MIESKIVSARIEKEYDPIRNEWESRVQFLIHDTALYSGFLAEIPPIHLHTLISLSLFMKDTGKINISIADFARSLGISFHQAQKRIEDLAAFRFQDNPILRINKTKVDETNERLSMSILPISPVTFVDERETGEIQSFSAKNSDYLFEYLRMMLQLPELPGKYQELLITLQNFPYELPPQVIEVLIEHVIEYKQELDQNYFMTIAHSWSTSRICTREQAEKWVRETKMLTSPVKTENSTEAYLLQFLRDRVRKQLSSVQINMIFQLLEEPFSFEPGCIEVLIDHVVAQISLAKGKPDFPKKYVEVVAQDWMERGIRTRQAAIAEVEEWHSRYSIKPLDRVDKTAKQPEVPKVKGLSKNKTEILEKLRKAGIK